MASMDRRTFLTGTLAAGAVLAASRVSFASAATAAPISLDELIALSPEEMARRSACVMDSWQIILDACAEIKNDTVRKTVKGLLDNPAPVLAAGDAAALGKELRSAKLTDRTDIFPPCASTGKTPQPFFSAPGSGWNSHHCYPGGLATHTALNVLACKDLYDNYVKVYDLALDRDVVLASQILHDIHKPWVFQWGADGRCRTEQPMAGTGEHHILSIAESLRSGLSADIVVAQACAHDHPGTPASEASVVNWLKAAAILCGKDPVAAGLLAGDGKTLPLPRRMEGFVTHLADHDFVLSSPACQWSVQALKAVAVQFGISEGDLDKKPFNQFRNYVLAQKSAMYLYNVYATRGTAGLAAEVATLVKKA